MYTLAAKFRHVTSKTPTNLCSLRQSTTAFQGLETLTLLPGSLAHEHQYELILGIRQCYTRKSIRPFCRKFKQNCTNMTPQSTLRTHIQLEFQWYTFLFGQRELVGAILMQHLHRTWRSQPFHGCQICQSINRNSEPRSGCL